MRFRDEHIAYQNKEGREIRLCGGDSVLRLDSQHDIFTIFNNRYQTKAADYYLTKEDAGMLGQVMAWCQRNNTHPTINISPDGDPILGLVDKRSKFHTITRDDEQCICIDYWDEDDVWHRINEDNLVDYLDYFYISPTGIRLSKFEQTNRWFIHYGFDDGMVEVPKERVIDLVVELKQSEKKQQFAIEYIKNNVTFLSWDLENGSVKPAQEDRHTPDFPVLLTLELEHIPAAGWVAKKVTEKNEDDK